MSAILTEGCKIMGPQYHEDELFVTPKLRLSNHVCSAPKLCFFTMLLAICFRIFWVLLGGFRPVRRRTMTLVFVWGLSPCSPKNNDFGICMGSFALFAEEQWPVPHKNDGDQLPTTIGIVP
jgi:hypothetical protein